MSKKESGTPARMLCRILFILYIIALVYFLFFADMFGRTGAAREFDYNFDLFQEIRRFWVYREQLGFAAVFLNLAGNVLAFVPFGLLLPVMSRKRRGFIRVVLMGLALSFVVECIQFITNTGTFDVDDLLLNTAGAAIGFIIYAIAHAVRNRKNRGGGSRRVKRRVPQEEDRW